MPTHLRTHRAAPARQRKLTLTPQQGFEMAVERHRAGQLDDAEQLYNVLLERWPDHPDVLNHLGVLRQQRGDHESALKLIRRAIELVPDAPGAWNNLGNVLLRSHQLADAERAFLRCIELNPHAPEAHSNLGRVHRRRRQWAEGEAACRRAIAMAPDFADAWHNLALVLIGQGRVAEGVEAGSRALTLLPPHRRRRDSYARALVAIGELGEAADVYRQWLAEDPDNAFVQHHLAACAGDAAPARASDAYVEQVFDDFADRFDAKLASLHYRAPTLVADALREALPPPARQFDIADLGCGTGLCGPLVRPWARHLAGCDLSAGMLDQARRRGVYDALDKAELVNYLEARPGAFDVIISADTLCYFGDLHAVAAAARRALRPQGTLVFTVEALDEASREAHVLQPHGRYAHGRRHVERALAAARFSLLGIQGETLRLENGRAVGGWLVTARVECGTDGAK